MKLRFEVDQTECFRRGIDCPKSIVTVEVDPAALTQEERNQIADRLDGIDVCRLWNSEKGTTKDYYPTESGGELPRPVRVLARGPSFQDLMTAISENQEEVNERQARHRAVAFVKAQAGMNLDEVRKQSVSLSHEGITQRLLGIMAELEGPGETGRFVPGAKVEGMVKPYAETLAKLTGKPVALCANAIVIDALKHGLTILEAEVAKKEAGDVSEVKSS